MTHYDHLMEEQNRLLLQMASLVEELVTRALVALKEQHVTDARVVIMKDREIDSLELQIDEHILSMLALYQPVAADLRRIIAAQKINNDLERIADHAVNIAESAIALSDAPMIKPLVNIPMMAKVVVEMLKNVIDSFVHEDTRQARTVRERDDEIDALHRKVTETIVEIVQERPEHASRALQLFSVSLNLERIADLATNIAEEVIFFTEAEVVKHKQPA